MKISEKRLVIEIDRNLHHDIKKRALEKKLTIKAWIMMAIAKAIKDESNEQAL
jgi:predicted HicB family RNase H-like nuclease